MRSVIRGCRKSGIFSAVLSLGAASLSCADSQAKAPLYSVVDGSWSTSCMTRGDLFGSYRIELHLQNAQDVARREYYFADDACGEALASLDYRGTYELIVTSRDFIYAMDLVYDTQSLEALNEKGQKLLEENGFCGRREWPRLEARNPLSFEAGNCTAVGPVPLKNFNLVQINRGFSLSFGADLAHENERPVEVQSAPELVFLSQPSP